jgi:hypothetical protein
MAERRRARRSIRRTLLEAAAVLFCLFLAGFVMLFLSFEHDTIWKWRVRGKVKPDALRTWAFQVISNNAADASGGGTTARSLSNAPAYLTNVDEVEMVLPNPDCVEVVYGGGMYHWGLTIGDTNLPVQALHYNYFEKWAPGIYYWNE